MRRLDRSARVLIPRFGVDVMAGEIEGLGFSSCREMRHAEKIELGGGVRVASYQYGFDDSTFVVQDGDETLVDLNDCKIRGRAMDQLVRDFGRPTFTFKGHSFAQGYPHCYEAEDGADLELIAPDTYYEDFIQAARALRPRYAIPFGSMVAFLHPQNRHVNEHIITPVDVARVFGEQVDVSDVELVTMAPGDAWSSEGGFERSKVDWYTERDRHLDALAESARPAVEQQTAKEAGRHLEFQKFQDYFGGLLRAIPRFVGRRLVPRPVVFHVPSASKPYFVVDFSTGRIEALASPPENRANLIEITEGMLDDAIDKRIVHFIQGTMRLHTVLRPGGVQEDFTFWGLLTIWELGYLPWPRLFKPRFLGVAWRRRREVTELLVAVVQAGRSPGRLPDHFASPRSAEPR